MPREELETIGVFFQVRKFFPAGSAKTVPKEENLTGTPVPRNIRERMPEPIRILAKPVVEALATRTRKRLEAVRARLGRAPKLSVVLVGEDPASVIYTGRKGAAAVAIGMAHETISLPGSSSPAEVKAVIDRLNADATVDGILIQRPLPKGFREEEVLYWVAREKDVDAFHPENAGRLALGLPCFKPCTPAGIMELLRHYRIETRGKLACVVGRSSIVGKPMAALLTQADATVIHCHSRTPDLSAMTRQADILVVAAGRPRLIHGSFIKPGAVVIDVGMHRDEAGKVFGDVDFESSVKVAAAITPVPGGVGPMTIAVLLENTVWAAEQKS